MAGHSKWAQIKRKKAVNDARRGQLFARLIREITVAAREGGGEPQFNPRLRLAVDTAKAANMPHDNIDRAIRRGTGELEGVRLEEVAYEAYGPGGVALYIETVTDNQNRTVAGLRHILDRRGGNLGTAGSVSWQFQRRGLIRVDASRYHEDAVLEAALEVGADDVTREDDEFVVTTDVDSFHRIQERLMDRGVEFGRAELAWVPTSGVRVRAREAHRLLELLEALEESEDVQGVYTNAEIDEAALREAV